MSYRNEKLTAEEIAELKKLTAEARANIVTMTTLSKSGHPGGSMSTIDFLMTLYKFIDVDPKNPRKEDRDIVVVSHGHVSPAVYTTLATNGFFKMEDCVSQFRKAGSIFEGHIEPTVPGVEWGTGNLGQGLSAACGFAMASRFKGIDNQIFCLMGDGEQQKGQLSEARRFAKKFNLSNITAFVDYNKLQISGAIDKVMFQNIRDNYISDGWDVIEIDGHNFEEIGNAIIDSINNDAPTLILANTIMGKDVSFMENKEKYHGSPLSDDQLAEALKELNVEIDVNGLKKLREKFVAHPHPKLPVAQFNFELGSPRVYTDKTDNRSAWGNAIADIAEMNKENNPLIAVFDCDLQGSVKTNAFEMHLPENFIQSGIMEHNTATMSGAMSFLGVQTFFADFGAFAIDETYNQHRLNDINGSNLKIIATHNGLNVGEDGKTHQCIDYVGLFRNLYNFEVIVPADPNQTDRAIRYLANKPGNALVVMGRSKQEILKNEDGEICFDENYKFEYGKADLLKDGDKLAIIAMGCMTEYALNAAKLLKEEGIESQVWNISSPNCINEMMIEKAVETGLIVTVEDHNVHSGLGLSVAEKMVEMRDVCHLEKFGVEQYSLSGDASDLYKKYQLDAEGIKNRILEIVK